MVMVGFGMSLGPVLPDTLVEEVGRLSGVVWELELSTARSAVHRVLAMFESHYQGLDHMALSGGWAPVISDTKCNELEDDCASFARDMADVAVKDLELLCDNPTRDNSVLSPKPLQLVIKR
jgi:hypothetical protein